MRSAPLISGNGITRFNTADFSLNAADAAIRESGCIVVENALTAAQVETIKSELAPWLQRQRFGRNNFEGFRSERVYALLAKSMAIAAIVEHPQVLGLIDQLLPKHYLLSACLAINVHPGETPQPFHTDDSSNHFPGSRPHPFTGVSTIWAFDDFTSSNGATEVIPFSHRWSEEQFQIGPEAAASTVQKVEMSAGSVVIFLGNTVHRGGANLSSGTRLGITPQYCMPWLRQIENMTLAVPPPRAALFSERIQQLLGYDTIDPGFMGYVDGVHPRRLIDPHYKGRKARGDAS